MPTGVYKRTSKHKKILSLARLGKPLTQEHKDKLREVALEKGFGKWMKGKKLSDETKNKIANNSNVKKTVFHTDEEHWNWKGGITPERLKVYSSKKYKTWRTEVFQRDNHTCQICLQMAGILNAHHIKSYADYEKLRFIISLFALW